MGLTKMAHYIAGDGAYISGERIDIDRMMGMFTRLS